MFIILNVIIISEILYVDFIVNLNLFMIFIIIEMKKYIISYLISSCILDLYYLYFLYFYNFLSLVFYSIIIHVVALL